jgi:uncharacterized repeat protein (TIGR03803 family)
MAHRFEEEIMKSKITSMKTQLTTLHNGSRTCGMTGPVPGRKPVLTLLMRLLWAAALALPALGAEAGVLFTNLYSFQVFTNGATPLAGLVQGSDGNFYGTTSGGGTNGGHGTVFKISTNGALTSLYSFTGGKDGANPYGALVQGSDGNFYGTTTSGGTNDVEYGGDGTVFKIGTNGALTSLYSFTWGKDGAFPRAALVQGSDGNFYGTTEYGGTNGLGTVFKISTGGALTSLYSFTGGTDGADPQGGLVQGSDGDLYGTTLRGGNFIILTDHPFSFGTVFKITTSGVLTSLYSFGSVLLADHNEPLDGWGPNGLVQGSDGNFYGTTAYGGLYLTPDRYAGGTVFKISANGALTSLYSFTGGNDGANPNGPLVQGSDGNFYGTTAAGGTNGGYATAFKISTNGVLTTLHLFTGGTDGGNPSAGLVQGSDGSFYGTTGGGGTNVQGTVFKMNTDGTLTSLYSFTRGNDGATPEAGLVQGSDGNFYGTTCLGGATNHDALIGTYGCGTVFKISTNGLLTSLYSFTGGNDGGNPWAGLVQGNDGDFYGTTMWGGTNGWGTVFKITSNGLPTRLYSFNGTNDGGHPAGGLVQGSDGNFYGTTASAASHGTVFKISPNGALTTLYSFDGYDGGYPSAGLVQGSDGNFYGTTDYGASDSNDRFAYGTVFKISSGGALTRLYSFNGTNDGGYPAGGLVQGSDGNLYGTTGGGFVASNPGTVFRISTNGALTTLHSFNGTNDGGFPNGPLVQGSDGNLYGTTGGGGTDGYRFGVVGYGTVFKISTNGALTTLYSFGGNDGTSPQAALVQGSDGSFYGTTSSGGLGGAGTIFRLTIVPAAPALQAVALTNGTLSLTWSTEAGGVYQPQFSSDLSSSNWTNLGGALTAAGATLSTTDSVTNGPRRFYRVVLSP